MKKRFLSFALSAIIATAFCLGNTLTSFAAGEAALKLTAPTKAVVGGTIDVDVSLENNPGVAALQILVEFDKDKVSFTSNEPFLKSNLNLDLEGVGVVEGNKVKATWSGSDNANESKKFFTLHFHADNDGDSKFKVTVTSETINENFEQVSFSSDEKTVTIDPIVPADGITLTPNTLTVEAGKTATIAATLSPANTTDALSNIAWTSSDTSVATATRTSTGATVKGVKAGTATITATINGTVTATATVTVTAVEEEEIYYPRGGTTGGGTTDSSGGGTSGGSGNQPTGNENPKAGVEIELFSLIIASGAALVSRKRRK